MNTPNLQIDFFSKPESITLLSGYGKWKLLDERPTGAHLTQLAACDYTTEAKSIIIDKQYAPEVQFIAIDKGLMPSGEYPNMPRCEGLFCSDRHLLFVELKDQAKAYRPKAKEQLKSTILLFQASHPDLWEKRQVKKAYICNVHSPRFQTLKVEEKNRWRQETGTRLDETCHLVIK